MKSDVLSNLLLQSKTTKALIELHKKNNGIDDFCVGYVLDYNDSFIVLQHVTRYGMEDGIHIDQISDLERIETEGAYLKACQVLYEHPEILPKQTTKKAVFPFSESWQYDLLSKNSSIGELIAFELNGDSMYNFGFLVDFDEDHILIHLVGETGESQGTNLYHIIDISSFGLDTLQCRKRRCMYGLRQELASK